MEKLFEVIFLDEVFDFLKSLERKHYEKILYNIRKATIDVFRNLLNMNQLNVTQSWSKCFDFC